MVVGLSQTTSELDQSAVSRKNYGYRRGYTCNRHGSDARNNMSTVADFLSVIVQDDSGSQVVKADASVTRSG